MKHSTYEDLGHVGYARDVTPLSEDEKFMRDQGISTYKRGVVEIFMRKIDGEICLRGTNNNVEPNGHKVDYVINRTKWIKERGILGPTVARFDREWDEYKLTIFGGIALKLEHQIVRPGFETLVKALSPKP